MPRVPLHALVWSSEQRLYECYAQGQLKQRFGPAEEAVWQAWFHEVTPFAFHGAAGSLNIYLEERPRGGAYWYAYHTRRDRTHKRYLGRTENLSLARLEETAKALSHESGSPSLAFSHPQPQAEQRENITLLSTKPAPPRLSGSLVERDRLLSVLDEAFSKPLTLLAASAGWGKTTLLAAWANRHARAVAWLSLDPLDTDPFRFWTAVIAALRTRLPDVGALALAMLHAPQPPTFSAVLTTLLNELAEHVAPLVLLLDDYQVIDDPVIQESVTFWVEHLPMHVHLLLASRVDPNLPLPRWRARGQLLEIRTDDIRFRPEEASRFLGQTMGLALSNEEVLTLQRRTEGWVAGLQLAALSLRAQPDPAAWITTFTGSHRYVLDYVQQEIVGTQPEPIQRFLRQVAVLTRMNAALCQAVTGELKSQEFLETLERNNLFVVPLDSERQWYRLHDLFREALLAQVQAREPELLPRAHVLATQWYEQQGELREAIVHALAAPDYPYAACLLEHAAPSLWLSGEALSVLTWLAGLPDAAMFSHARLAWMLLGIWQNPCSRWFESQDGTTIAFDRSGQGPAVILVGGAFQYRAIDPRTSQLATLLAKRFTVFHYDRRGRGESSDTQPYAVEREMEDLEALMHEAGGSACVFGMSSGGALALDAAARGLAVTKLALYELPFNSGDEQARAAAQYYTKQLTALLSEGRRGDAVALAMTTWGAPAEAIADMRQTPIWPLFEAVAPTLAYDNAIMGDGSVPAERLASLVVPTLVIAGGASPAFIQDAARAAAHALPNAHLRTLEGQTHEVAPEILAPVLAKFFTG